VKTPEQLDMQAVIEDMHSDPLSSALLERSVLRVQVRARDARIADLEQAIRDAGPGPA
jgi:hypothetical protein